MAAQCKIVETTNLFDKSASGITQWPTGDFAPMTYIQVPYPQLSGVASAILYHVDYYTISSLASRDGYCRS